MGISNPLPTSWETCIQVKKQQNRIWNNRLVQNWESSMSRLYLSLCLLSLYAEYIMRNAGLDEAQARIKITRRNISNFRYADDTTVMADRKWGGNKDPLDESERVEWKSWLKLNIQKMKIMACSPIISWQVDGEAMETVTDLIFLGSKITADGKCSHEIKRWLFLGRKAMINLDSILKSRDIALPTKVHTVKVMVFQ